MLKRIGVNVWSNKSGRSKVAIFFISGMKVYKDSEFRGQIRIVCSDLITDLLYCNISCFKCQKNEGV